MTDKTTKSIQDMSKTKQRQRSLTSKTLRSTIVSCMIFGLVAEFVALTFYSASHTKQLIKIADSAAHQAKMSATHGSDAIGFSKQVMEIYYGLSDEELQKMGTEEYRQLFSDLNIEEKGGLYDNLVKMLAGTLSFYEVYDVYIGMYDEARGTLIYVVDPDPNEETRFYPGDWEKVEAKEVRKFLNWDGKGTLYDIGWMEKYGLLCTVGLPMKNKAGELASFMLVDISVDNVLVGMGEFALQLTVALGIVTMLLAFLQHWRIKKALVEPINQIAEAAEKYVNDRKENIVEKERFAKLNIHTGDEIENLSIAMADMERELAEYEMNLTKVIAEKERIGTELSLARRIQASMMPHVFPAFPERSEFDLYAMMSPAREVGGDFYDFFLIDEDHLCLVIADVSGKGIPAALFMMISKIILQSCAMLGKSAAEILTKMNEALCSQNPMEMFVTVWLSILEISTGRMTAANAGHEYPVIKRKNGEFELFKDKHGLMIAGMEDSRYKEYELQFEPGDKIFVYTDGIPEATDNQKKMFGTAGMVEALNRVADGNPQEIIEGVRKAVADFVEEEEQFDDITMLCMEYKGMKKETNGFVTVEAITENLYQILDFIDGKLEGAECSPKAQVQIDLAVEEIFANVANYAYAPNTGNVTVTYGMEESPKAAIITFEDTGVPYNPLQKEDPNLSTDVDERQIGGLGIFMVKKNVDDMVYEYRDGKNVLTIKKYL